MNSERVEVSLFEESEVDKDNSDVSSTPELFCIRLDIHSITQRKSVHVSFLIGILIDHHAHIL